MSHKINHREVGEGPILILLHGFGGTVMHWDTVVESLKSKYKIVVPNISHVFLSQDRIFFTVQVEIIAKYIRDHYPNQKVHVGGFSFGGALAWGLSVHYPELVDRLILINPLLPQATQLFIPPEIRYFCILPMNQSAMLMMLGTPIGKAMIRRMAQSFRTERSHGPGRAENLKGKKLQFVAHLIHRFMWILRNEDWSYWKAKIVRLQGKRETLFIYDRQDYLFSAASYLEFADLLGATHVREIDGAGHLAIKTRPDLVANLMEEFLSSPKVSKAG